MSTVIMTFRARLEVDDATHARLCELRTAAHRALNAAMRAIMLAPEGVHPQTHAYRAARDLVAEVRVPGGTIAAWSQLAWTRYRAMRREIARGDASIPCWRYPAPICVRRQEWRLAGAQVVEAVLTAGRGQPRFRLEVMPPVKSKKRRRISSHAYWYAGWQRVAETGGDLKIQWDRRKRVWMGLFSCAVEVQPVDPARVLGVHWGMVVPVQVATADAEHAMAIGDPRQVWRQKERLRERREADGRLTRGRRGLPGMGGRGEERRMRVRDRTHDYETRWLRTLHQQYAARVVQMARRWKCGTLAVGTYPQVSEDETNPVKAARAVDADERTYVEHVALLWRPYAAAEAVRWAARKAGLEVVDVPEIHLSRTCAACGHEAAESRVSRALFRCTACGHEDDAEVNAARNLARHGEETQP